MVSPITRITRHTFTSLVSGDVERARGIYELAVNQARLDMPEILWKAYIDFEIEQDEPDKARELYRRLLTKTQHVKVWLSFAQFELSIDHEDRVIQARHVYEDANKSLRYTLVMRMTSFSLVSTLNLPFQVQSQQGT